MQFIKTQHRRVIIATGIFPPDLGGPATFAKALFDGLRAEKVNTQVLTFGENDTEQDGVMYIRRSKKVLVRYWKYFCRLFETVKQGDVIYAFDLWSVGLPCAILKILKPSVRLVIRLGGDFQWEQSLKSATNNNLKTLEEYYQNKNFKFKEKVVYYLTQFVLKKADFVIFNAKILKDVYIKNRGISFDKTGVVGNIISEIKVDQFHGKANSVITILFAGRLIAARNLYKLVEAFASIEAIIEEKIQLVILGEGLEKKGLKQFVEEKNIKNIICLPAVSWKELLQKIANSDIVVIPSMTEVNSNFATESLVLGKPVVLTKNSEQFYTDAKNAQIYFIDPQSTQDIARGLKRAVDDLKKGMVFSAQSYADNTKQIIQEHLEIFYENKN